MEKLSAGSSMVRERTSSNQLDYKELIFYEKEMSKTVPLRDRHSQSLYRLVRLPSHSFSPQTIIFYFQDHDYRSKETFEVDF